METVETDRASIQERLGDKVLEIIHPQGDDVLLLQRSNLRESFRILRDAPELNYDFLSDITAVDYWKKKGATVRAGLSVGLARPASSAANSRSRAGE
jgi:hypothetical protein